MKLGHLLSQGALFIACAWGCDQSTPAPTNSTQPAQSMEWVGYHTEVPWAANDFHALISGLVGPDAQNGKLLSNQQVTPGVLLTAMAETATNAQSRVALTFNDGTTTARTLALVPASFSVGTVFLTAVDAAIATMQSENAQTPGSGESFLLQYKVVSPQGGTFTLGVHAVAGAYTLVLDVSTPQTSLMPGKIGTPVGGTEPYDTVDGTVWFHLSKDDFDYFASHAYGADSTAAQNFNDFALSPHNWLRLTVDPHLTDQFVNVGFDVLGLDGTRTPVARAPASVLAGAVFQTMVDRNMTTMQSQEQAKPGSSTPWQVPFFYDAPVGGGIVQVLAQGSAGTFVIAYAIEAPQHTLVDVPFLPYEPVMVNPAGGTTSCDKLGNAGIVPASEGAFSITFTASNVVKTSPDLHQPLVGDLDCAVYNSSDVSVDGPNPGAQALSSFVVPHADLGLTTAPHYLTSIFPKGSYQILCFQDLAGTGNAEKGNPVTLPIGSFPIACNLNPVTVQFALLDPQ